MKWSSYLLPWVHISYPLISFFLVSNRQLKGKEKKDNLTLQISKGNHFSLIALLCFHFPYYLGSSQQYTSSSSGGESSCEEGRMRRPTHLRPFHHRGDTDSDLPLLRLSSDPDEYSSSEQSCDTVIYVGPNGAAVSDRELTDNEEPPEFVPIIPALLRGKTSEQSQNQAAGAQNKVIWKYVHLKIRHLALLSRIFVMKNNSITGAVSARRAAQWPLTTFVSSLSVSTWSAAGSCPRGRSWMPEVQHLCWAAGEIGLHRWQRGGEELSSALVFVVIVQIKILDTNRMT